MNNLINNKREEVKRQLQELLEKTKELKSQPILPLSTEQENLLTEFKNGIDDLSKYMEDIVKNTQKLKEHEDSFEDYMSNVRNDINKNKK